MDKDLQADAAHGPLGYTTKYGVANFPENNHRKARKAIG